MANTATAYATLAAGALGVVDAMGSTAGDIRAAAHRVGHSRWTYPEVHLAYAMLTQAIRDATVLPRGLGAETVRRASVARQHALRFVGHRGEEPFSFEFCCAVCGVEPGPLRRAVLSRDISLVAPRQYQSGLRRRQRWCRKKRAA